MELPPTAMLPTTAQRICAIMQEQLCCDPIAPERLADPELLGELKADSLDMIELIMLVEEHFDIGIDDDAADIFRFPNDTGTTHPLSELVTLVDARVAERAAA